MIEKIIAKVEKVILESLGDRMEIVTEFDAETMFLNTASYWDGVLVSENELDLNPLVDAILARVGGGLDRSRVCHSVG